MKDYELLIFHKLDSLLKEAQKTDNPLSPKIEELTEDAKSFIRQNQNQSLVYIMGSMEITQNNEWIKKILDYLNEKYNEED